MNILLRIVWECTFFQSDIQSLFQGICIKDNLYLCLAWMIFHDDDDDVDDDDDDDDMIVSVVCLSACYFWLWDKISR